MGIEGRVVTLNASSYSTPPYCCSCGAPKQTEIETSRSQKRGNVTTTLRMNFPYCGPCAERVKAYKAKLAAAYGVAVLLGLLIAGIVIAIPALPTAAGVIIGLVVGVGGSVGAAIGLRPPMPAAPATARGEAARIVSFNGIEQTKIFVSHAYWGDEFARANNAIAKAESKGDGFLIGPIVVGAILAPIAAIGGSIAAHPTVYVDNATAQAIDVYLDGKKAMSLGPNSHKSMDVGYGKHSFGYAPSGAAAAANTVDGEVKMGDAHLYNPAKSACYWLVADSYGSASVAGISQGPQPIQDFYRFDKVDNWFASNPQSISTKSSGETRVALQRSKSCMQFVEHGCSLEARSALVTCQRGAKSDADFDKCFDTAKAMCTGGGHAAPPTTPAAGKPAAPATPAPKPATPAPAPKKK
jgi:hypothetical protein